MSSTSKPVVLLPGKLNDHAVSRLVAEFDCRKIDKADPALISAEIAAQTKAVACMTAITPSFIDALPNLEIIANFGVGYDAIDAKHAAKNGVMVTNTPDVLSDEVADTAIGLLINTLRELPKAEAYLREGRWVAEGNYPLTKGSLRDRKAGIFGMGRIGLAIARRLDGFGVPVSYHNRSKRADVTYPYHSTLVDLASGVDILICIAPGGAGTEKAVNAEVLSALGENGVFINVGRGSSVDEEALIDALDAKTIMAAGLDVFADEPNVPEALMKLPNVCLLPHVASASIPTRTAMADLQVDNIVSWFENGRAITPVAETAEIKKAD